MNRQKNIELQSMLLKSALIDNALDPFREDKIVDKEIILNLLLEKKVIIEKLMNLKSKKSVKGYAGLCNFTINIEDYPKLYIAKITTDAHIKKLQNN